MNAKPAIAEVAIELRPTIGHAADSVKPAIDEAEGVSAPLTEPTRTADASHTLPVPNAPVTMSDAGGGSAWPAAEQAVSVKDSDTSGNDAKPEAAATSEPQPDAAKSNEIASSASETVGEPKAEAKTAEVKSDDVKAEPPKAEAAKSIEKPAESKTVAEPGAEVPAIVKDQAVLPASRRQPPRNPIRSRLRQSVAAGGIAVFASAARIWKLYVRQNFLPLFDVPVTIAPSDRPLGTHVFTAQVDKEDSNVLHWSVVTLPARRVAERRDEDERISRRRKIAGVVDVKPLPAPDSPAEALDRLNLPADVLARITEALSTGGSLIVSDQGIAAGETGEGTDFIVSLR